MSYLFGSVLFDFDEDGDIDLFTANQSGDPDWLFRNDKTKTGRVFTNVALEKGVIGVGYKREEGSVGTAVTDFDNDDGKFTNVAEAMGLTGNYRNGIDNGQSLRVSVRNASGAHVLPGAEVRFYDAEIDAIIGSRLVDTGGGYNSRNAKPVFFGLSDMYVVDVEVTTMSDDGRRVVRIRNIDPKHYRGTVFTVEIQ